MPRVERTIIVHAPVDRVYQWWARMENVPQVLPRVRAVKRTGPFTTHWEAEGGDGQVVEWDATIVQDLPHRQLAWESRSGPVPNRGNIDFEALGRDRTRVKIAIQESSERPLGPGGTALLATDLDEALARFQSAMEASPEVPPLPVAYPYRDLFYRAMAASTGVMVILGLAWSLVALIEVWVIVLGAALVGATLAPMVDWLMRRGLPRAGAVGVTFLAVSAGVTVILMVLIPQVMTQGQDLAGSLPAYVEKAQAYMTRLHARYPAVPEGSRLMEYMAETASQVLGNAFSMTGKFVWLVIVFISILFLAFFMLLDGRRLVETLVRLIPIPQKSHVPALLHTVDQRVGRFMLGLAVICAIAGVVTWWAMALLGVPYALLVGAVTALLQAVPFVGPLAGGALAGLLGLSVSGSLAIWALVVYTAIQQVIGQALFPLIMGRTIGMHPVWVMVVLLVGGTLYGLTGAFLAIPVAIAVSIVLECYYLPWADAKSADPDQA